MKTSFAKRLLGLAAAFALAVPAVQALPPISKEVKVDPKVKTATDEEQFKHGMRLIVTLKDKTRVQGTLVLANDADNYMLIRTRAGALPTKVQGNNIADITRIRLTGPSGTLPDEPEIHQVSVINGDLTQVKYFAPTMSPQEKAKLAEIENAYGDLSQSNNMKSTVDQAMYGEMQSRRNAVEFQHLSNSLMGVDLMYMAAGWFPAAVYSPFLMTSGSGVASNGGPADATSLGNLLTMQAAVDKQVAKSRQNLTAALSNTYFEGDQLVAVIPDAKGIRPAVAPEK